MRQMTQRWIVAGIVLSALLGIGWWVLGHYWAPILFWSYMVIAAAMFLLSLISNFRAYGLRKVGDPLALESAVINALERGSPFRKFRFNTQIVIACLTDAIAWPAALLATVALFLKHPMAGKKVGSIAYAATVTLNLPITTFSVALSAMTFTTVATSWLFAPTAGYRHSVLLLFAMAVMLKHLNAAISYQSLATTLRRSLGDPHVGFVIIAIADLVTLILALSAYSARSTGGQVGFDMLRETANNILTLAKIRAVFSSGGAIGWYDVLVAVSGGLFILNGFKSVFKYQEFRRTNDDYHAIAARQLAVANHREARRWLDKVQKPDPLTYELYAAAYLAAGDLDKAMHAAATLVEEKKIEPALRANEVNRVLVSSIAVYPMSRELLTKYLQHWFSTFTQDLFLLSALEATLQRGWLRPDEVLSLFTTDEERTKHALLYGSMLLLNGEIENSRKFLGERNFAVSPEEFIRTLTVYRCLWVELVASQSDESRKALEAWEQENIGRLPQLTKSIKTDYERLVVIEHLYIACDIAERLRSVHKPELDELAMQLREEFGGDERILQGLGAIDALRRSRQQEFRKFSFA